MRAASIYNLFIYIHNVAKLMFLHRFRRLVAASAVAPQLGSKKSLIYFSKDAAAQASTPSQSSSETKVTTPSIPSSAEILSVLTYQAYMARYTEQVMKINLYKLIIYTRGRIVSFFKH